MSKFRAGLVQMCSGRDVERNLEEAGRLIREAAAGGAEYVQTPEFTTLMEMSSAKLFAATKPEEDDPAIGHFQALARELGIWLHIGSTGVLVKPDKIANRSYLFTPTGGIAARYDKIHMFDAVLGPGESFRESKNFQAGDAAVVADLPWGPLGLTICYDLRFPGLYRALAKAGAVMLAIPSAFTRQTGAAHWHTMLRTRAIETGAYVLAAAQSGKHESGRETFGHSLVASPWGDIVAECKGDVQASVILADIDCKVVADARRRMPSLEHDRPFGVVRADPPGIG